MTTKATTALKPKMTAFNRHLKAIDACAEARTWAKGKTAQQAWDQCDRADWLLWWVAADQPGRKADLVRCACKIARLVLHLVTPGDDRPRLAIEAAERWADAPTQENLELVRAAEAAAWAAARAAEAAAEAEAVAWAAGTAAWAAWAAARAAEAAWAAARAAEAAARAAEAAADIKTHSLAIIRELFSCPWTEGR